MPASFFSACQISGPGRSAPSAAPASPAEGAAGASTAEGAAGTSAAKGAAGTSASAKGTASPEGAAWAGPCRRPPAAEGTPWTGAGRRPAAKGTAGPWAGVRPWARAGPCPRTGAEAHAGTGTRAKPGAGTEAWTTRRTGRTGPEEKEGAVDIVGPVKTAVPAPAAGALQHQQQDHRQNHDNQYISERTHRAASFRYRAKNGFRTIPPAPW